MKNLTVAIAQISPRLGNLTANLDLHLEAIEKARQLQAGLVVFPELSMTGYLLRDQVPDVALGPRSPALRKLKEACREIDALIGFVEEGEGHRFYNSAIYLSRGRKTHIHRKLYLPTYGMFDEARDFAAGERLRPFVSRFGKAGVLICEDIWHSTSSWLLAQEGAELLFVLSSGPTRGARPGRGITSLAVWHELACVTAQFQTAYVVYVNRVGFEDGLNYGGGSRVIDPFGRTACELPPLEEALETVELSDEVLRRARTAYPLLRDENLELVYRELGRIRRDRFGLPGEEDAGDGSGRA
jgi:predicted amidohydrolase